MPKRNPETPAGIRCQICGEDKPPYHFFKPRGKFQKYTRWFFVNGMPDGHTCWDCGGEYRCLGCGHVKPAHQFRIQGRYCVDCLVEGITKIAFTGSDTPSNNGDELDVLIIQHEADMGVLE